VPAALERIVRSGGKVLNGPETIPSGGVIAQCMDPQGGGFALFAPGKK
jgi:predicted enzyme related to lactoylglutathione lyase